MKLPRSDRALAVYWVLSAAVAGMAAGAPWAWMLIGLWPAVAFSLLAGVLGRIHWLSLRARPPRWTGGLTSGLCGILIGLTLGSAGAAAYPWPDGYVFGCFPLAHVRVDSDRAVALVLQAVGATFGFVAFGTVGGQLRRRARRWSGALSRPDGASFVWAAAAQLCLGSSVVWTVTNEWFVPGPRFFRYPCDPDVGPLAILGYAAAGFGFAMALGQMRLWRNEVLDLRGGRHATLAIDRGEKPQESSVAWTWADASARCGRPASNPERWAAVVERSSPGDYRSKPSVVGWVFEDGAAALRAARRRRTALLAGLAVTGLFCGLQFGRSLDLRGWGHGGYGAVCPNEATGCGQANGSPGAK